MTINGEACVLVDVRPDSDSDSINLMTHGVVPIAILGSPQLDVRDIDPATLTCGPNSASPTHRKGGHLAEANGDDFDDLVSHYNSENLGLALGDTLVCVSGEMNDGSSFESCGAVSTRDPQPVKIRGNRSAAASAPR